MHNDDKNGPDDGITASYMISPDYGDAFAWRPVEGVDSRYTLGADSGDGVARIRSPMPPSRICTNGTGAFAGQTPGPASTKWTGRPSTGMASS